MEVELHTRLEKTRVEPADFDAFRKFHEDVSKYYRVWLTLKPAAELEDAAALEALLALDPDDLASAQALARLYAANGQSDDASRVLRRALHYHPKDPALWELRVKAAGSLAEEEEVYREMTQPLPRGSEIRRRPGCRAGGPRPDGRGPQGAGAVDRQGRPTPCAGWRTITWRGPPSPKEKAEQALKHLEAADKADAEAAATPEALLFKGEVFEKLGKPKEAAEAYRRLADMDGNVEKGLLPLIRLEIGVRGAGRRPRPPAPLRAGGRRWTVRAAHRGRLLPAAGTL